MRRIRSKILISQIGGLLFTSVISTLAIQVIIRSWLERHVVSSVQAELEYVADYAADPVLGDDRLALQELVQRMVRGRPEHVYFFVLSANGSILASSFVNGTPTDVHDANLLRKGEISSVRSLHTERGYVLDVARGILDGHAGEVHLGVQSLAMSGVTDKAVATLLVIQGGSLALAILASFILADIIVRPMHQLLTAVHRVGAGDLDVRLGSTARDEVGGLGRAFDAMVSDLRRSRSTLEEMAAHAHAIVASFPNALFVTDVGGRIASVNPAAQALTAYSERDILGWNLCDLFVTGPERQRVADLSDSLRRDGMTSSHAMSLRLRGGTTLPVAFTSAPMLDAVGRFHGFVVEVSDLSRLRVTIDGLVRRRDLLEESRLEAHELRPVDGSLPDATETHLVRSDRLVSLGQLAASVAHEINNPLFGMMTCAKVLERDLVAGRGATAASEMLETVRTILAESERCTRILRGLLDYGRVAAPRREHLRARTVLEDVRALVAPLAAAQKVELALELADEDAVHGDSQQLHQVVLNLAMNAIQAMPQGGRLSFATRNVDEGRKVEIVVRDTGEGIPPENLKKVFEPFFTTKEKGVGTGLGLSIAKGIVARHGGTLFLDSEVGKGTEVRVVLPASPATSAAPDRKA